MRNLTPPERGLRALRPSILLVLLASLLLALVVATAGCGGDADGTETTAATAGTATTAAPGSGATPETTAAGAGQASGDIAKMNGTELGTAVVLTWNECLTKVNALLSSKPEPAAVQAEVEAVKEECVQKLVALGRQHATFDEEQLRLWRIELGINSPAAYGDYQTLANEYIMNSATPQEFKDLIMSFNIITQYSDFGLLKQQEPEEAARLGVQ